MNKVHLPHTDSIAELAQFWDEHDLTDFEDGLEEIAEPVFVRNSRDNDLSPFDEEVLCPFSALSNPKN